MFAIFAEYDLARRIVGGAFGVGPMRTLRQIQGQIQAVSLRTLSQHHAQLAISIIVGAYLSLQLVAPGTIVG